MNVDSRTGSILVFYDQMDHDIFLEFPPVYWSTMLDLWKEEKYKFREIFLLRRSHIWRLFLVLEIHDTSLKKSRIFKIHSIWRWSWQWNFCLGPVLEIVNSSVGFVYSVGSYLSIECMYRSRTRTKYKIQNNITKYKIQNKFTKYKIPLHRVYAQV